MDTVVVNLAEALSTFSTAVRACSGVQVHVVLELEFGGQLEITDTAVAVAQMTQLCGKEKEIVSVASVKGYIMSEDIHSAGRRKTDKLLGVIRDLLSYQRTFGFTLSVLKAMAFVCGTQP